MGARVFGEAGGVIGDQADLDVGIGDLGGDHHAGDRAAAVVLVGDAEEGGDGLGAFDLEELAHLGAIAVLGVEGLENRAHGAGFVGLAVDLAILNASALGGGDRFEGRVGRKEAHRRKAEAQGQERRNPHFTSPGSGARGSGFCGHWGNLVSGCHAVASVGRARAGQDGASRVFSC